MRLIILFLTTLMASFASATVCNHPVHKGINLAGGGFAPKKLPGVLGRDYTFPSDSHIDYYAQAGFRASRLSIIWERLQPALFDELDPFYLAEIDRFMSAAASRGQLVLIDLHNYGRYRERLIGSDDVPDAAFADIWRRIAARYKDHPALYAYGLMNEPHDTNGLWEKVAQAGVDGVRSMDKSVWIFVGGDSWSSAHRWPDVHARPFVSDPVGKLRYEAHVYFDSDESGRYRDGVNHVAARDLVDRVDSRLAPFVNWLTKYGQLGVIGEWGVPDENGRWLSALDRFVELAETNCLEWYYWAGGPWSKGYELSLEPIDGVGRPQLKRLSQHLRRP